MTGDSIEEDSYLEQIEINLLLEAIFQYYGFDFRNYVKSTIRRRIWHRIKAENLSTVSQLQHEVLHNQNTMTKLLGDFSINVTEMFRDPGFFSALRLRVLPLLKQKELIRIWHAGCSSGEEVYSMAILLYEENLYNQVRIYATDMNELLIDRAAKGGFPLERMQVYTKNYISSGGMNEFSSYYTVQGTNAFLKSFLTKNITFAQHNLATDQSFNEFDIILCRNVLIYFNRELQSRVHSLFYQSLTNEGFLGLGSKESIAFTTFADKYRDFDIKEKIYQKTN